MSQPYPLFVTMVFQVNSKDEAENLHVAVADLNVTATSTDHEIHRIELIEEAIEKIDRYILTECLEEILSTQNITSIKSVDELGWTV